MQVSFALIRNILSILTLLVCVSGSAGAQPLFDEKMVPAEGETLIYRVGTTYLLPIVVRDSASEQDNNMAVSAYGIPGGFYASGIRNTAGMAEVKSGYFWTPTASESGTYRVTLHAATSEEAVSTRTFNILVMAAPGASRASAANDVPEDWHQ